MYTHQNMDELKVDVKRAFKASLFSMDYQILRIILDASEEAKEAYSQQNYLAVQYIINQSFWNIGMCIKKKISSYACLSPDFFAKVATNIKHYLKNDKNIAFTEENLKRCYKLVEIADETWFKKTAARYSWSHFVSALDQSTSFSELKDFLSH